MDRYTTTQAIVDARHKLLSSFQGKLATIMRSDHELSGYPLASVVPYVLDGAGHPIVLISWLADHTKNLAEDGRATLLLHDSEVTHEVQSTWRIALVGDIAPIPNEQVALIAERYYAHFPSTQDYHRVMDFTFHRLMIRKAHVVMGFGQISWISGEGLCEPSPFDSAIAADIIAHMNADHQSAMQRYVRQLGVMVDQQDPVDMLSVNQYGITVRHEGRPYFIAFPEVANTAGAVRQQLVMLAKTA